MLDSTNRNRILRRAIATYGKHHQTLVAIEEMSELTKELCKRHRGKNDIEALADEIADVSIMLDQLQMIYDCRSEVKEHTEAKLLRLEERLNDGVEPEECALLNDLQIAALRAYADEDMVGYRTARRLGKSLNTVYYHLEKIYERTGLDPRVFHDLNRLLNMIP